MTNKQIEFYKMLLQERYEMMPLLEANAKDPKDRKRACSSGLIWDYRFIGITEFLVNGDVALFRAKLSKCAELRLSLFRFYDAGEPIDTSCVSMLAYKQLFDALAAGNFSLAKDLAEIMGGRSEAEKEQDIPFTRVMGYALKEAVLANGNSARKELNWLFSGPDELKDPEEDRDEGLTYRDFRGYGVVFDGIATRNERTVSDGLAMVIEGHARQAKRGIFQDTNDRFLCIWGIGMANLARSLGIPVHIDHELIPKILLI